MSINGTNLLIFLAVQLLWVCFCFTFRRDTGSPPASNQLLFIGALVIGALLPPIVSFA